MPPIYRYDKLPPRGRTGGECQDRRVLLAGFVSIWVIALTCPVSPDGTNYCISPAETGL